MRSWRSDRPSPRSLRSFTTTVPRSVSRGACGRKLREATAPAIACGQSKDCGPDLQHHFSRGCHRTRAAPCREAPKIDEPPLYPGSDAARAPPRQQILRLLSLAERHRVPARRQDRAGLRRPVTERQREIFMRLGVSETAFRRDLGPQFYLCRTGLRILAPSLRTLTMTASGHGDGRGERQWRETPNACPTVHPGRRNELCKLMVRPANLHGDATLARDLGAIPNHLPLSSPWTRARHCKTFAQWAKAAVGCHAELICSRHTEHTNTP